MQRNYGRVVLDILLFSNIVVLYIAISTERRSSMSPTVFTIGVVGYCPPSKYDKDEAERLLREALEEALAVFAPNGTIKLAGGWSDVGIHGMAYHIGKHEFGWYTIGYASSLVKIEAEGGEYKLFPVDEEHLIGLSWGDESEDFVASLDLIIRIGGGPQSHRECAAMIDAGKPVITRELPKLN